MKLVYTLKIVIFSLMIAVFSGCGIRESAELLLPETAPLTRRLPDAYNQMTLKKSTSSEVLDSIKKYKQETISQSESVVACWGEKKKTHQLWQTAAFFNDENFTLWRKYFLTVDERPWLLGSGQRMLFEAETVVDKATLTKPYTSKNRKKIAIIEKMLDNYRSDMDSVKKDSRVLNTGAMMANEIIRRLLYFLNQSPALAAKLSGEEGLLFDLPNLGSTRAKLSVNGDIARVSIRSGRVSKKFGK